MPTQHINKKHITLEGNLGLLGMGFHVYYGLGMGFHVYYDESEASVSCLTLEFPQENEDPKKQLEPNACI